MSSSTWGPSAFRARKTGRSRTRRLLNTIGLAALTAGLVLLVTFTSGVQDLDEVMLAIGATVASLAAVVAVRSVQSELAFHEAPRLERVHGDQAARRGQPAVPTPLTKITRGAGALADQQALLSARSHPPARGGRLRAGEPRRPHADPRPDRSDRPARRRHRRSASRTDDTARGSAGAARRRGAGAGAGGRGRHNLMEPRE